MYVTPQPLTFDDLARAMQCSAGLGQTTTDPFGTYDSSDYVDYGTASSLPLSTPLSGETNPSSPNYNPYTTALVAAGTTAGSSLSSLPWGTIALFVGGAWLLGWVFEGGGR